MTSTIIDYVKKIIFLIGIFLIILGVAILTIQLTTAVPETTQTKICQATNLTYTECGQLFTEIAQNNTQYTNTTIIYNITNNVTNNYTQYTINNITNQQTIKEIINTENFITKDQYDAKIALIKAELISDLYKHIKDNPIKETIYVNNTINPDDYVKNTEYVRHLNQETNNNNPQNNNNFTTNDNTKFYFIGIIIILLAGYYFYKQNKKPQPTYNQNNNFHPTTTQTDQTGTAYQRL